MTFRDRRPVRGLDEAGTGRQSERPKMADLPSARNSLAQDIDVALDAAGVQMPSRHYAKEHGSRAFAKATILPFLDYLATYYVGDMEIESAVRHLAMEIRDAR